MNVLSIFDGMSGAQLALNKLGVEVNKYYASEIDKFPIAVTQHNFPDTVQLGDVTKIEADTLPKIDLLIGGSPCQGFSKAGQGLNFKDERSKLFFEFVRLLKELKPKYFLLENVFMKKEWQDVITSFLGVKPILINSALVSAQHRKRLYWTNLEVTQPQDKGILIKDIIETEGICSVLKNKGKEVVKENVEKSHTLLSRDYKGFPNFSGMVGVQDTKKCNHVVNATDIRGFDSIKRVYSVEGKCPTLTTCQGGHREPKILVKEATKKGFSEAVSGDIVDLSFPNSKTRRGRVSKGKCQTLLTSNVLNLVQEDLSYRKLTPLECERLQTVPDNYTLVPWQKRMMSNTQRYKMLGNGFTVDVIAHILSFIPQYQWSPLVHKQFTNSSLDF